MTTVTKEQINSALKLTLLLAQAIHAAGAKGIPSGELYAMAMRSIDLATYERAIGFLKDKGLVRESNYLLNSTFL